MFAMRGGRRAARSSGLARLLLLALLPVAIDCASPSRRSTQSETAKVTSAATWDSALPPIRIRSNHTATLVGTGEVLVAGGQLTQSTELIDPYANKVSAGPTMLFEHSDHTATMLLNGKVLLAGGNADGRCELYDPVARAFTATGTMKQARNAHAAIRLRSGKVLVIGGGGPSPDPSCEIYDPATGAWTLGPPRLLSGTGAAATLADGRVLSVNLGAATTRTELFDPVTSTWSATNSLPQAFGSSTLTRLFDGRVLVGYTESCGSVGGPITCSSNTFFFSITPPQNGGPKINFGRDGFSAVRTPKGEVLFIGGEPTETLRMVERFDPATPSALAADGNLSAGHRGATSTILPGGDVLTIGGSQAVVDRRVTHGSWRTSLNLALLHGRSRHASVRLHDGSILVTGGDGDPADQAFTKREADVIDVVKGTVVAAGAMTTPRTNHTMTALRSGKVLITGGDGSATAEIYDPAAIEASRFKALPSMSVVRASHAATLLPSGDVLISGGDGAGTAELFVAATSTFEPLPKMIDRRSHHGAVLLKNGKVLLVSDNTAELYDPTTKTFRATNPPGAGRDGRTAHALANGKVFVSGGSTLAADLFDPVSETWSFTSSAQPSTLLEMKWTALPDGRLVTSGGHFPVDGALSLPYLFDPTASPSGGAFITMPTDAQVGYLQSEALAGSGDVVVTGGQPCFGACVAFPSKGVVLFGDDVPVAGRPTITQVATKVTPGSKVTITGSGFADGAEASDGLRGSAANHPSVIWVSDAGDTPIHGTITEFTNTSATWIVPATALYGHGQLFVSVAGALSHGAPVEIEPAPRALTCAFDAECNTGFCVDGVCCDRKCDGICEGCSKARKLAGEDGVCGAVPPGKDVTGRCVLKLGEACTAKEECGPNFCSQGVCCDSSCEGQCLACNQPGKAGRCSAINEGACGAACDGDHTLKQIGAPDVDCAPFKCGGPRCNTTCASVKDCVAPAVCSLDGQCVPATSNAPGDDSVCGCRVVGAASGGSTRAFAAAFAFVLYVVRRRRRDVTARTRASS